MRDFYAAQLTILGWQPMRSLEMRDHLWVAVYNDCGAAAGAVVGVYRDISPDPQPTLFPAQLWRGPKSSRTDFFFSTQWDFLLDAELEELYRCVVEELPGILK